MNLFLGTIQYLAKFYQGYRKDPKDSEDYSCLAHYAKDRDTIVTTDASKTVLGITLWQKQSDGQIKPKAFGSRYLKESKHNYSIRELELLAVVCGLEKFRFYLCRKKLFINTDHQALEPLIKRNRRNTPQDQLDGYTDSRTMI